MKEWPRTFSLPSADNLRKSCPPGSGASLLHAPARRAPRPRPRLDLDRTPRAPRPRPHTPPAAAGVVAGECAAALAAVSGPPPTDPEAAVARFRAQVNTSEAEIEAFLVGSTPPPLESR
jgi:hypothetical protein